MYDYLYHFEYVMKKKKDEPNNLPIEVDEELLPVVESPKETQLSAQAEDDFEEARATYKELIDKGKRSLDIAMGILEGSEHPRAVEVFAGMLRTIADVNDKIIALHSAKQKIKKGLPAPQLPEGTTITQNNITVGSTQDILNAFKELGDDE